MAVLLLAGCETIATRETPAEAPAVSPPPQAPAPAPLAAPPSPPTEAPPVMAPPVMAPPVMAPPVPAPDVTPPPPTPDQPTIQTLALPGEALKPARWSDLPGWSADSLTQAWPAWLKSCSILRRQTAWHAPCAEAQGLSTHDDAVLRTYFQTHFLPYRVIPAEPAPDGLITGYYEPLLRGSRVPSERYRFPLRAPPEDLLSIDLGPVYPELKTLRLRGRLDGNRVVPYYTRGEIEAGTTPSPGTPIAWVDDPVELFFLQVQGSGRLKLDNGDTLRIGYADQNGHPYRSIGKWLVERGELSLDKASMQGIKDWARRHPERLPELLAVNPSYIFFRELPNHGDGPLGALGVPLTPERSLAIDPRSVPLGAPVWLATSRPLGTAPLNRLMLAQDTGSAIKGTVRGDFFWGFGDEAGRLAGAMKQRGRMWVLLPRDFPLNPPGGLARNRL
ncbi:MAG: murein transglycosylase A [Pseudomonadota bacterium]